MIIELFSGIGRFDTNEEVVYVSNDIHTKPTILADVRYLPLKQNIRPRILHGSPPCRYISKARCWNYGYNFLGIAETMELYAAFYRAVDWLKPENISFESPANIEKFLGEKISFRHPKYDIKNATTNLYYSTTRQMKRAELHISVRNYILNQGDKT